MTNAVESPASTERRDQDAPPSSRPLFVPRALVSLAAIWVFLSWILLFGIRPPVQPQAASYGPSLEILFISIGVGIAIGWPMLRLSARPSSAPRLQALFDSLALFLLLQVVVWPLRLVSTWSLGRTWLVVAVLGTSIVLTGAILALSQGSRGRRARAAAMVVAVVMALAPLGAMVVGEAVAPSGAPGFSAADGGPTGSGERPAAGFLLPASAPAMLSRAAAALPLEPSEYEWALVGRSAAVGGSLWLAACVFGRLRRPESR